MLQLFKSIFSGGEKPGCQPEPLLQAAMDRVAEATDPRLRALPGYRKRLMKPVCHAIDHVVGLVDSLPPPLHADREHYGDSPLLRALFSSPQRMCEQLARDPDLRRLRRGPGRDAGTIRALLLAQRSEKKVLGMELVGDKVRQDVAQVTVSFRDPRLVDLADSPEEARGALERRTFDYLLSFALKRIADAEDEREELGRRRSLLRRKLKTLEHEGWDFEAPGEHPTAPPDLEAELKQVEEQLEALGAEDKTLPAQLERVAEILETAERQLWAETVVLHLDRMNVVRSAGEPSVHEVQVHELHTARGRPMAMVPLLVRLDDLPPPGDALDAAERYLGS